DEIRGGLVASKDQQPDHCQQLLFAEPVSFFLNRDQLADQVVRWLQPFVRHQARGVVREGACMRPDGWVAPAQTLACGQRLRPDTDLVPVVAWHAEHLRDDVDRQGKGVIADEVYLALRLRPVEQLIGDLLHTWAEA